ncbi:endonuclease III domain-containing protein [Desulfosarcina variabilis]|uniref:endonuclease III domain-containing protein n=1 Tax=Desulfosarcina variabilis TaxID=2300 RepID=UPI003AFAFCDA
MQLINRSNGSCSWDAVVKNKQLWRRYIRWVDQHLEATYSSPLHGNYKNPTNEVFYIILSKKTPPDRYIPVFKRLRRECGSWNSLIRMPQERIEQILQPLGISRLRANQIKKIAQRLHLDFGKVSLNPLKTFEAAEAKRYLKSLPGVGEKSARCVMMYSLGIDISPMDTHATRVLRRFGLLPESASSDQAHKIVDMLLPGGMAKQLHVNLVAHGRKTCTGKKANCPACVIKAKCYTAKSIVLGGTFDE